MATLQERFDDKWVSIPETSCNWWVSVAVQGYGHIRRRGKWVKAHRVAYELYKGEIPEGMSVCHKCDNTLCVNPDHLFLGTHTDNMRDKVHKGRAYTGEHKGVSNGNAKLTDDDVRAIRTTKGTCRELASTFGISPMTVSLIKRRLAWAHVE